MAGPILKDRVKQTSTTTGTGTLSLDATLVDGFQGFVAAIGNGNTCYYCIAHRTANEWEVGLGTVADATPDTLARTTVLASSNSNNAVNFSAGIKDVFVVAPADYGVPLVSIPTTRAIQVADQTALSSTAGNARGSGAVDLQSKRFIAGQAATGSFSTIGGGRYNTNSGTAGTVGGGDANNVSDEGSTIGGGKSNRVSERWSTIAGGRDNNITSKYSSVGGGKYSYATGFNFAVIAGGYRNTATGYVSSIGGGFFNLASGTYSSIAGGFRAVASKFGQHSHAAGRFGANGDAQTSQYVLRNSTSNSAPAELFLDGSSARLTISADTTWVFDILIVARRTDADGESAAYRFTGCIDNNAGTTALVGSVTKVVIAEDTAAWDADVTADDTNDALIITVTGENAKTIQWVAFCRTVETTG